MQYYRSLYNVEQVEILRGPNALLFGRGGTGGIINRVSKKAMVDDEFGSFMMGTDTFGSLDIAISSEPKVSVPIMKDPNSSSTIAFLETRLIIPPVPPLPKSRAFGPLNISTCSTLYRER